jgi:hypothetical protein
MANSSDLPDYFKRLAALIRQWCCDEHLIYSNEKWVVDRMIDWLWKDPICSRRLRAAGLAQGVEDRNCIASDYLGDVLARNPNALARLLADVLIASDAVLVSTARRRVVMRVQNLLFHRWVDSSKIESGIYRALWLELKNRPDLYILLPDSSPSPRYVTMCRNGELRTDRPLISLEEMLRLVAEVWKGARQIPACVRTVLGIVRDDPQWCVLAPIHDVLFDGLCEAARLGIMRSEELRYTAREASPDVERVLKAALVPTMQTVQEMLLKYTAEGKLTASTASGLYKAVEQVYADFGLSGDRNVDHAEYVLSCCPGMSREAYQKTIRNKFQYIMREANATLDREFRKRWGDDSANPENDD